MACETCICTKSKYLIIVNKIFHRSFSTCHKLITHTHSFWQFSINGSQRVRCSHFLLMTHTHKLIYSNDLNRKRRAEILVLRLAIASIDFQSQVLACNQKVSNNESAQKPEWLLWKPATISLGMMNVVECKIDTMKWCDRVAITFCVNVLHFSRRKFRRLHVINFTEIPTPRIINFWFEFYSKQ